MVAVVTGAAGFIGRRLVEDLAALGPVVGIDRHSAAVSPKRATHVVAELLDPRQDVAARPDANMHRYRDNGLSAAAVLAATPADTPVFVASSSSVYGGSRNGRKCAEGDSLNPLGCYAHSKVLVEQICAGRAGAGGRVTVFRPFTVAGEGQRPGMAFSQWIKAAREGRPLRLLGSPDRTRDITDVAQMSKALIDLAAADRAGKTVGLVNIGTGHALKLGELISAIRRVLDVPIIIDQVPAESVEVEHTLADTTLLEQIIGWAPRTDLHDLVARQVAATEAAEARQPVTV